MGATRIRNGMSISRLKRELCDELHRLHEGFPGCAWLQEAVSMNEPLALRLPEEVSTSCDPMRQG